MTDPTFHNPSLKIDLSYLQNLGGNDPEFLKASLEALQDEVPAEICGIQASWEKADYASVSRQAHGLKGSFQMLGLSTWEAIAQWLEKDFDHQAIESRQQAEQFISMLGDSLPELISRIAAEAALTSS